MSTASWRAIGWDWSSPIDKKSVASSTEAPPIEPSTPEEWRRRVLENAYSIPHVVGTCRMGPSPDGGDVVDALGRVHGVERLSVIDASIIPDAPSGFPHVVTIMLAEHLSEKLIALL